MIDKESWTLVTEAGDEETVMSRARLRLAREGLDLDVLDGAGDIRLEHIDARPRFFWRLYLRRGSTDEGGETA
jgi:hypothetical protein